MERINAEGRTGAVCLYRVLDPAGSVAGHKPDCCPLLRRQLRKKLLQHRFPIALSNPDDGVGIVIQNQRQIFVALLVGSFINRDPRKSLIAILSR